MNNFKQLFYYMIGRVPAELHEKELKGRRLLHVSDTPSSFLGELKRLVRVLQPDYIVHTGDLVDNIKLELYPGSSWRYERDAKQLIELLEQSQAQKIFLAMGNHDDQAIVQRLCKRSHIIEKAEIINIEGLPFSIAHYPREILEQPAEFNLFGHNLAIKTGLVEGRIYLNGITSINLIELETKRYFTYPYPAGTDNDRLGRGKIGL